MDGCVDKSYGINVAKLADLPEEVITKANELLEMYESNDHKKNTKRVKQFSLDLKEEKKDELIEFLSKVNPLEITPIEALNILDQMKKIS